MKLVGNEKAEFAADIKHFFKGEKISSAMNTERTEVELREIGG